MKYIALFSILFSCNTGKHIQYYPFDSLIPSDKEIMQVNIFQKNNGTAIPGATISVFKVEQIKDTFSSEEGRCDLTLAQGIYNLRVSSVGYENAFIKKVFLKHKKKTLINIPMIIHSSNCKSPKRTLSSDGQ